MGPLSAAGLLRRFAPRNDGSDREFTPRNTPIGIEIAPAGGVHDAGRQWWRRRVAIPAAGAALGIEIIAQRLFVEARLRLAGFINICCPEPRTVGRHHLVDQDDIS